MLKFVWNKTAMCIVADGIISHKSPLFKEGGGVVADVILPNF